MREILKEIKDLQFKGRGCGPNLRGTCLVDRDDGGSFVRGTDSRQKRVKSTASWVQQNPRHRNKLSVARAGAGQAENH